MTAHHDRQCGICDATLPLTDKLKLNLGARLFRSNVRKPRPDLWRRHARTAPERITPGAALSWRPRSGRLLFLRYGSAFRQGGVDIAATASPRRSGTMNWRHSSRLREDMPGGGDWISVPIWPAGKHAVGYAAAQWPVRNGKCRKRQIMAWKSRLSSDWRGLASFGRRRARRRDARQERAGHHAR